MPADIGSYRILGTLGEGGMGVVYLGEHRVLGRRAAIKVLHATLASQPEIVQRVFNEARAATAVSDPGIVQVFDFGYDQDGRPYIVMELLDGEPLDRRLARCGRLVPDEAMRIARQVASTLSAAHANGIVHRDLKPENVFLVRDPEVPGGERAKVLDFGIAKLSYGDSAGVRTRHGVVMGTPAFMSPEQCRGAGEIDARSDVYALGCVLFTLVTGEPPFSAEGMGDVIAMHLREAPRAPSQLVAVPAAVDAVVAHCLAKSPAARFQTMLELVDELDRIRNRNVVPSKPRIALALPAAAMATPNAPTTLSSASGATASPPARRRMVMTGLLLATVLGVVLVARFLPGGSGTNEPSAKTAVPVSAPAELPRDAPAATPPLDAAAAAAAAMNVIDAAAVIAVPDAAMPMATPDAAAIVLPPDAAPAMVAPDAAPAPAKVRKRRPAGGDPCDRDNDGVPESRC